VLAQARPLRVTCAAYSSQTIDVFETIAQSFTAEAATPVAVESVQWEMLYQKLTTDLSSGTNSDISIVGTRWLPELVANGLIEPFDNLATDALLDRFSPALLQASMLDGKLYGLPVAASSRLMYCNLDLFQKAGLSRPPETWDELRSFSQTLKEATGAAGLAFHGQSIEADVFFYYALLPFGGSIIMPDGTSGLRSEAAIAAADFYRDLITSDLTQPGVTGTSRDDTQALFIQGRAAMCTVGPWFMLQLAAEAPDLNYSVVPVPAQARRAIYGVTDTIVIFANSKQKEQAAAFLEVAFRDNFRADFERREGFIPVTREGAARVNRSDDPRVQEFTKQLQTAIFAPLVPRWEEIADMTINTLQDIYLGRVQAATALPQAADRIDLLLKNA